MNEELKEIALAAALIEQMTQGKDSLSLATAREVQRLVDDLQGHLDTLMNDLTRPENHENEKSRP